MNFVKTFVGVILTSNFLITQINNAQNCEIIMDFSIIDNSMIVDYPINGVNFKLIFDTGSGITILDSIKSEKAGLKFKNEMTLPLLANKLEAYILDYWDPIIIMSIATSQIYNFKGKKKGIDGILGVEDLFLKNTIVLDFEQKQIHAIKSNNFQPDTSNFYTITLLSSNLEQNIKRKSLFGETPCASGILVSKDTTINTMFYIDTGSRHEIVLLIKDSLDINNMSVGKKKYSSLFQKAKAYDYTITKYKINGYKKNFYSKAYMFKDDMGEYSMFGSKPFGALLGLPFLKKIKLVIIDWPARKLYLQKS